MIIIKGLGSNALITQGFGFQVGIIEGEIELTQGLQLLNADGRVGAGRSNAYASELEAKRLKKPRPIIGEVNLIQVTQDVFAFGEIFEPIIGEIELIQIPSELSSESKIVIEGSIYQRQFRQRFEGLCEVEFADLDDEELITILMLAA